LVWIRVFNPTTNQKNNVQTGQFLLSAAELFAYSSFDSRTIYGAFDAFSAYYQT
jgi:hypothetical protein